MAVTTEHGERVIINPGERIAAIESQIETERRHFATKADIADLRTEISKVETRLTWRMILIGAIFQAIGVGTILYFLP